MTVIDFPTRNVVRIVRRDDDMEIAASAPAEDANCPMDGIRLIYLLVAWTMVSLSLWTVLGIAAARLHGH